MSTAGLAGSISSGRGPPRLPPEGRWLAVCDISTHLSGMDLRHLAEGEGFVPSPSGAGRRLKTAHTGSMKRTRNAGGGRGIRTPGTLPGTVVFKTTAIDHSAIPPAVARANCERAFAGAGPPSQGYIMALASARQARRERTRPVRIRADPSARDFEPECPSHSAGSGSTRPGATVCLARRDRAHEERVSGSIGAVGVELR